MTSDSHEDTSQDFDGRYTVGADLRMAREERGLQIRDVVDAVRIQSRYIEALEDGRVEDLPGTVYALGFVRTYADYLGLDGSEMVGRFKEEARGLHTQEYVLPEPIDEGKVPTTAIIIIAVLLAGVAYGAWHFLYRSGTPVADLVPDVPDRLAALVPPEENAPSTGGGTEVPVQEAPAVEPGQIQAAAPPMPDQSPDSPVDQPQVIAEVPPAVPPAPVQARPPEPAPKPETETQPAAVDQPAQEPVPEATVPPPQEAPSVAVVEPAPPPPAPEPATTGSVESPQTQAPPSPPAEPVSHEPRVFGVDNTDSRIVIKATEDAWIEVTDADGALLFSRVLRTGDSYRVPDRRGAVFVTGNAGGLSIVVDGDAAPQIGPAGVVRRNVRLDPDQLKAGTAWP